MFCTFFRIIKTCAFYTEDKILVVGLRFIFLQISYFGCASAVAGVNGVKTKYASIKITLVLFSQESLLVLLAQLNAGVKFVFTQGIGPPASASVRTKRVAVAT